MMRALVVPFILVAAVVTGLGSIASAENPNVTFSGRIMASAKRFSNQAKSPGAYIAMVRKNAQTNFFEDKKEHTWTIYLAGFLKNKLDDVEYTLKIVDVTGHSAQVLSAVDQYTDERGQQTILTKLVMDKKIYGVNKEVQITMESKGRVLATGRIKILGEGEHYSGKVDFSEDEASGHKKDDDN